MALSPDKPAPYTSTATILGVLERNRSNGMPSLITKETLARIGVSDSLIPRTLQALNVLDLIDDAGNSTDTLRSLRAASEAEYPKRMTDWLDKAYADIIQYANPSDGDETAVRDAFRSYSPPSMLERMVTLFTGLYGTAGVWPQDTQRARTEATSRGSASRGKPRQSTGTNGYERKSFAPPRGSLSDPPPAMPPNPETNKEKALEYRLIDLMPEAVGEQNVMEAIITIVTFLKTKDARLAQNPKPE